MLTVRLADLDLRDGMTALDLGCGAGRHLHAMFYHAYVNAIGVDLGFEDVKRTRYGFESYPDIEPGSARRFGLAVADATRLPFPDKSFDVIVCSEVLEHIPDFGAALKECARLLKPGGRLAVTVPRFWPGVDQLGPGGALSQRARRTCTHFPPPCVAQSGRKRGLYLPEWASRARAAFTLLVAAMPHVGPAREKRACPCLPQAA